MRRNSTVSRLTHSDNEELVTWTFLDLKGITEFVLSFSAVLLVSEEPRASLGSRTLSTARGGFIYDVNGRHFGSKGSKAVALIILKV